MDLKRPNILKAKLYIIKVNFILMVFIANQTWEDLKSAKSTAELRKMMR